MAGRQVFPDHHPFTEAEIAHLRQTAGKKGARLVTTEKDFVRLAPEQRVGIEPVAVSAVFDDEAQIAALLDRIYPPRNKATP
jgi:tetraacyldisaccharide 4'-kinase